MRLIYVILAAVLLLGCHEFGTWKDDGGNWKRIFRTPKPDDITIVHSWFWRSPHLTYEYEYYIQIQKHADLQRRLLTMNPMSSRLVGSQADVVCPKADCSVRGMGLLQRPKQ